MIGQSTSGTIASGSGKKLAALALALLSNAAPIASPVWATPAAAPAAPAQTAAGTEADQLLQQGAEQFQQRQWQAAEASWQQALTLYRQAGDRAGEGRILGNLGAIQDAQGQYRRAIELFQQSLTIARETQDARGQSFALTNLAYMHRNLGDYAEAVANLEQALPITRASDDREGQYAVLNQLGIVYRELGRYDEAIDRLQQSLAIARAASSQVGEANVLGNLGNTYTDQGNYPAALSSYQQALALMQQTHNPVGQAGVLQRLGLLYATLGNSDRAVEYYNQSLAMARSLGDRRLQAYNLGNLGKIYYSSSTPARSLDYLRQALALMQQLGDRASEGKLLHALGNAYMALQDYPTAKTYFQQSLALARQVGDRAGEGISLGSLAMLLDLNRDHAQAVDRYRESIAILQAVGDRPSEGRAWSNLGSNLLELGKLEEAKAALLSAIDIWESLRPGLSDADQISLFETQAATYRTLQRVLIQLKQYNQALEVSEWGRSRAFVELVARRLSVQAASRFRVPPPTIAQIRQVAQQEKATLVQYSILDNNRLAIWVVPPNGEIQFRETALPQSDLSIDQVAEQTRVAAALGRGGNSPEASVTGLVQDTRAVLTQSNPSPHSNRTASTRPKIQPKLRELHRLLIEPIADLLPRDPDQQIVFMPQGALFLIPFAALQDANGTFLIEQHTIRTAPAIQVLALTHERQQQQQRSNASNTALNTALIVGNPTMPAVGSPPEPLNPLPFAEQEAQGIARILHTTAIVGGQATEDRITQQMSHARLIHLATHGLLDDISGLGIPGALALAPTASEDGLLTTNEILNLSLNQANLVVLSACNTGRGKITGDGVVGLSRSFISAGASSVLVSLWAVPDDSTSTLMQRFYQNLQQHDNKAQALRQAILTTMQQYPSSRDWAAFTLIGEAN